MARHKKSLIESVSAPDLDVSSLIDICFLLLIYFLVTTTIVPRERDLALVLPHPNELGRLHSPIQPLFIRVASSGAIFTGVGSGEMPMDVDSESRELPLLESHIILYQAAATSADEIPLVQLWVDPGTVQQRVIDVLNTLSAAGIVSVTFTDLVEPI